MAGDQTADSARAFAISANVLAREVGGEMVLLNLEAEQYYGLNCSGTAMVTRLTTQPLADAMASLEADFDVDPAVLHRDVDDLINALVAAGLVDRLDNHG